MGEPTPEGHMKTIGIRALSAKQRRLLLKCLLEPHRVMFLDIETTGLSLYYDDITIVGWSLNGKSSVFVNGESKSHLIAEMSKASVLITFNGTRFDVRFLKRCLPSHVMPDDHLDLRYICRRVGLRGGQKFIENQLGIDVRTQLKNIDGSFAPLLWHRYLRGDTIALEQLIMYNRADIAAMGLILDHVVDKLELRRDLFLTDEKFYKWASPPDHADRPAVNAPDAAFLSTKSLREIIRHSAPSSPRIVGIDLTGSEARKSGWCFLVGEIAKTELLSTDAEILAQTVWAAPDLVSIDSPLCMPAGRTRVGDDDPGRHRFGITRACERELRRRGVHVYPCLIPSMQQLTARGILLAAALRAEGIPVIESYPGAAQDIMRIPRKGAGVEWLREGLTNFGVRGDLERASHDELDAVTSALVGTFHWVGQSEALGTDEEPPLIIPKLGEGRTHCVVGVSGPIAAGKTTLARALEALGFAYTRFSMVIDEELRSCGQPLDRVHRQALGSEINRSGRQRWLAEQTLQRAESNPLIVVDGLRFPEDHAFLAERYGGNFLHVFVDADEQERRRRYIQDADVEEFEAAVAAEVEQKVALLKPLSHVVFANIGSKHDIIRYSREVATMTTREDLCQSRS